MFTEKIFGCKILCTGSNAEAAIGNFGLNINDYLCSIWKKIIILRQLLVSDVV